MSSKSEPFQLCNKPGPSCDVPLRDLQSLLRQSMGSDLRLICYRAHNLLPRGENFSSTILKITPYFKLTKDSPEESLELVAKMILASEVPKDHFNTTVEFRKEIFIFEKLIPAYRELQKEAGFSESELLSIAPKIYGTRLSLNSDSQEADEDVAILMEDLIYSKYKTMDRKNGLDFQHAALALTELAKYHVLGIVCRQKKPEFFNLAKNPIDACVHSRARFFDGFIDQLRTILCSDSRIAQYEDRLKFSLSRGWGGKHPENMWTTFTHGDFRVNNILFHHDGNGKPTEVKFVDFQNSSCNTGLRDLPYFLFCSCDEQVVTNNIDELLKTYYEAFVAFLVRFKIDSILYTKESFNEDFNVEARDMLLLITMGLKFMTINVANDFDIDDYFKVLVTSENSINFLNRMNAVVQNYVKRNWI